MRQLLVLMQVTFSVILLVGAGLFVRSLVALQRTDSGVEVEQVLQMTMDPVATGYTPSEAVQVYERIRQAVVALPQVRKAAFVMLPLLNDTRVGNGFYPPGYVPRPGVQDLSAFDQVSPGFFETLGIPWVSGREFTESDDASAPRVVVINEKMAQRFFGDADPIGRRLTEGPTGTGFEIVGVVRETKFTNMREDSPRIVFLPFTQWGPPAVARTLYVRTAGDPRAVIESVRAAVRGVDRNIPIYGVKTLAQQVDETLLQERLTAILPAWFGGLALFLAALGLYGLIHYTVQRRRREFGLRIALGAAPRSVARVVLGEALMLVGIGIAVGLAVAIPLARARHGATIRRRANGHLRIARRRHGHGRDRDRGRNIARLARGPRGPASSAASLRSARQGRHEAHVASGSSRRLRLATGYRLPATSYQLPASETDIPCHSTRRPTRRSIGMPHRRARCQTRRAPAPTRYR